MPKTNTNPQKIQEVLSRGVERIYPNQKFLEKFLKSGQKITIYYGIDPTGPSLHLGHAIELEKLHQLQALGHKIIILIGDFTATIGDPTDKTATRQPLTRQQVLKNARDYKKQAAKFLKFTGTNKAEWKYNSKWFAKMKFTDVLDLATKFTVQQLLERDMFDKRIKQDKPISLQELMYPVMQAYDSVVMKVDGEIGGNDQTFNMLAGRTLMKQMLNKEKFVLTMKLLTDTRGAKMGKSEGNMLNFNDSPEDMFGKIMSWTDEMIVPGFELCTQLPITALDKIKKELKSGANPKDLKIKLAETIVSFYYSDKQARAAGENFSKIFSKKENPDDMPEFNIKSGKINPVDLLIKLKFVSSKGEAKRLITGGGMKLNKEKVPAWDKNITIKSKDIIQAGKRKFGKIK